MSITLDKAYEEFSSKYWNTKYSLAFSLVRTVGIVVRSASQEYLDSLPNTYLGFTVRKEFLDMAARKVRREKGRYFNLEAEKSKSNFFRTFKSIFDADEVSQRLEKNGYTVKLFRCGDVDKIERLW